MAQSSNELNKELARLQSITRKLERKLLRSEKNRSRLEEQKEKDSVFLHSVLDEALETQRLLEESEKEAKDANRAKGEFLANISHEIRTPINAMLGMTEILQQGRLSAEQRQLVEAAAEAGQGLLTLISSILDFSKAEAGKIELEQTSFELRSVVESIVAVFGEKASQKGLSLGALFEGDVPGTCVADASRLRQVLMNLLSNALKFTEEGSVKVRVSVQKEPGGKNLLRFAVEDTGIGVPEDAREILFKPFRQADGSTTREYGGTGLGLSICKDLVELMGGSIHLESSSGKGSVFVATVGVEVKGWEVSALGAGPPRYALVVDSDPVSSEVLYHQLKSMGFEVAVADSPDDVHTIYTDALEHDAFIEAVFVDLDGGEDAARNALKVVDRCAGRRRPLVGLVSSVGRECSASMLAAAGHAPVFNKPTRSQELRFFLEQQGSLASNGAQEVPVALNKAIQVAAPRESLVEQKAAAEKAPPAGNSAHKEGRSAGQSLQKNGDGKILRLKGTVLLVEDNPVNQMVARGMLGKLGCTVHIASNGREGWEAWSGGDFDLVLMDCQMPVWDGYRCTTEIRRSEEEEGRSRTPIVALTANAMAGDREKCLQTGMDDYLSKPFSLSQLQFVLLDWLEAEEAEEKIEEQVPDAALNEDIFDMEVVRGLIKIDDNDMGFVRVLSSWIDSSRDLIKQLETAIHHHDNKGVQARAHTLKSCSGSVGVVKVFQICQTLEQLGRIGVLQAAPHLMGELKEAWEAAHGEAIRYLEGKDPVQEEAPKQVDGVPVLVVDDDNTIRQLVRAALTPMGCRIIEASSGEEALEIFEQVDPSLVLLDVFMDGLNGFEVCQELRLLTQDLPIIIMTGMEDLKAIEQAYNAGATDFVVKPFNLHVIQNRVRYMLRLFESNERLRNSEARLAAAYRLAGLGDWWMDLNTGMVSVSEEALHVLNLDPEKHDLPMKALRRFVHPEDKKELAHIVDTLKRGRNHYGVRYRLALPNGERIIYEQAQLNRDSSGVILGVLGTVMDVTEQVQAQERIHTLAYYDGVTNLPNRALFIDCLESSLEQARVADHMLGVCFVDLDRFKRINDTLGHSVGDHLLQCVSERIEEALSSQGRAPVMVSPGRLVEDGSVLARFGGDEFVLLLPRVEDRAEVEHLAAFLLESLNRPFFIEGHEFVVTASIGMTLFPDDGQDVETLLKEADLAMFQVKAQGGNGFRYFTLPKGLSGEARLTMETELRKALDRGEFEVFYQPKMDAQTWEMIGAEALIRWRHPEHGLVSPADFIPLAEETGLIVPIGEWVLRTACKHTRGWLDNGLEIGRVAVNLSRKQFGQSDLVDMVRDALREANLEPEHLELEVTESMVMSNVDEAVAIMKQLQDMGVALSIDDFGTGHSSLTYLRRFPINSLKIDRSFIQTIEEQGDDKIIVSTIVALGKALRLSVVAEGVETTRQLGFLCRTGCDEIQGYLISPPLAYANFSAFIEAQMMQHRSHLPPTMLQNSHSMSSMFSRQRSERDSGAPRSWEGHHQLVSFSKFSKS